MSLLPCLLMRELNEMRSEVLPELTGPETRHKKGSSDILLCIPLLSHAHGQGPPRRNDKGASRECFERLGWRAGVGIRAHCCCGDSLNKNFTIHHLMTQPGFGAAPLRIPGSMTQHLRRPGAGELTVVHVSGDCGNGLFPAPNPKVMSLLLWTHTHTRPQFPSHVAKPPLSDLGLSSIAFRKSQPQPWPVW